MPAASTASRLKTRLGEIVDGLPYGQEGVLVQEINVEKATGLLAARYAPERYQSPHSPERYPL